MANTFESTEYTPSELEKHYGKRTKEVGLCFKLNTHYYKQRENDVLHLNINIINTLYVGALNAEDKSLVSITEKEFDTQLKEIIFNMGIYEYCNNK